MAEAVGIVLAVAPLVISAFEDYEATVKCFRAFKGFSQKIRANLRAFNVQEVIFRKANERLLSFCVGEDHARQMLADRNHPSWRDVQVASLYLELLGDSRKAFEDSIELINDQLAAIRSTLDRFEISEGESPKLIRNRIKYAFKESNIEAALAGLTEKTRDLVTLIDLSIPRDMKQDTPVRHYSTCKELDRFSRVQETAEDLYQALGHACTKHTDHQAHLSLEPVCCDSAQIRFTIAFSQLSLSCPSDNRVRSSASTWLTVESSIIGRIQSTAGEADLVETQQSLKRAFNNSKVSENRKTEAKTVKKCVRFQDGKNRDSIRNVVQKSTIPPLINLCSNNNFCDQLQKFINQSQPSGAAVGFLDLSGGSKHLVYIDFKSQIVMQSQTPATLNSLQDALKDTESDIGFALAQRISLARQLAKAVLQFHTTPWLRSSWGSREVLVSRNVTRDDETSVSKAFIAAQINGLDGTIVHAEPLPSPVIVRNQLLFSLGVMLLELAFRKPLNELTIKRDIDQGYSGNTAYLTADRLSRQVSAHMGPRYAEAARKCIHCDFGCGFDLKQSRLRERFYRDVICELERLEERVKGL